MLPLPASKREKTDALEALARASGHYREFAGHILFTPDDVQGLLQAMAARRTPQAPADTTPGHVVFLGARIHAEADVFMGWAPVGGVQDLMERVRLGASGAADLLDYAPATYGQFLQYRARVAPTRQWGNWYWRTKEFNEFVKELLPEPVDRVEDDMKETADALA